MLVGEDGSLGRRISLGSSDLDLSPPGRASNPVELALLNEADRDAARLSEANQPRQHVFTALPNRFRR